MAEIWTGISDFLAWVVGQTIGKLFLLGILVFPAAALLGFFGLLPRKRK